MSIMQSAFDDYLNESHDTVKIFGLSYMSAMVIKDVDPTHYRGMYLDLLSESDFVEVDCNCNFDYDDCEENECDCLIECDNCSELMLSHYTFCGLKICAECRDSAPMAD